MAGFAHEIKWSIGGVTQLRRRLHGLALSLSDFTEPLRQVGAQVIYPEIVHQFRRQGQPRWQSLQERYAARKRRKYGDKPILQATGALMASLTDPQAAGAIYELDPLKLTIGTSLTTPGGKWNLGLIHQEGAERASIPARPMLRLRPSAQTRAVGIFHRWFLGQGKEHGVGH